MTGPLAINPPDDTGSDTFRRYRYQAEIAFVFCLDCALVGNVVTVVPEHIEDIAIEHADGRWIFVQVKTRDPAQGPWTLSNMLRSDGGAFRSVLRTHRALVGVEGQFSYELRLEGGLRAGDDAEALMAGESVPNEDLIRTVASKLDIGHDEAAELLRRLTIRPNAPSRETITAVNVRKLGQAAPSVPMRVCEDVYRAVIGRIETAMESRLTEEQWPQAAVDEAVRSEASRAALEEKRLNRPVLEPLLAPLAAAAPVLLNRLFNPDHRTSALEDKLASQGASAEIIANAKALRAHASFREAELQASSITGPSDMLEDLRMRLLVVANASAAHVGIPMEAGRVWAVLQRELNNQRDTLDQNHLMNQDPMLLLGEVCELSDQCAFDWSYRDA